MTPQLALTGLELKEQGIESLERHRAIQFGDSRLPVRFWQKVAVVYSGCWEWTGYRDRHGYGRFWMSGGPVLSHRLAYETLVDPIPEGLEPDHLCRTPACVNPAHMESVTRRENTMRGLAPIVNRARNLARTSCINGHKYTQESVYVYRRRRVCRPCAVLTTRRWRQRQKGLV